MQIYSSKIVLVAVALIVSFAPQITESQTSAKGEVPRRYEENEDKVAKLFESVRAQASISQLKRIPHRSDLEQAICTSALTGYRPQRASAFYTTPDPATISPELQRIALSNRLDAKRRPWYTRYAVAVWRVKDAQTNEVKYWVGLGLYETALGEFVDCHFTDDVHYCGNWKRSVAEQCRGK